MTAVRVVAGSMARVYECGGSVPRAVALEVGGRTIAVDDRGPLLEVGGGLVGPADLVPVGEPALLDGGRRLHWAARHPRSGLELACEIEADATGPVIRTRVTLSGGGRLASITPEAWAAPAGRGPSSVASGVDLGQPVLGDGWFAGLEHPGAENLARATGGLTCRLALESDLALAAVRVPPVVVGAAPRGDELAAFWDHLDRIRARPAGLVVLANNWYQLGWVGRMHQDTVLAELDGFAGVAGRHGLALDHYCLDDPWDGGWEPGTGIWGRLDPARFAGGFDALAEAAGGAGRLGLWVSPWGGYYDRHDHRTQWGREHGFEVEGGAWPRLCPAGPRYRDHLRESMCGWARAGVAYWKLDGVQFDCADRGHGHAVGAAGRTDQIDRFASLLDDVRAANPAGVLVFTTGSNPSPWWLCHADFLWRGGLDDDAPEHLPGSPTDRFDTYIDSCLDAFRATALPVSAVVTFSVVENQARAYRGEEQSPQAWERHCWLLAARGTLHHDLYVAPDSLREAEWDHLARALAWTRAHQRVLARARMIGGRPQAAQPYGFVGQMAGRLAGCVRNPSDRPASLSLAGSGLGSASEVSVDWGRPALAADLSRGEGGTVDLEPFEVVVFSGASPVPPGRPGNGPETD